MNTNKTFISEVKILLTNNEYVLSPFSNSTELDIDISKILEIPEIGQIWINDIPDSKGGEIVIRTHSRPVKLSEINTTINSLLPKVIIIFKFDVNYQMRLETETFLPDESEDEDAGNKYLITLNLSKKVNFPSDAINELNKLVHLPIDQFKFLLEKV